MTDPIRYAVTRGCTGCGTCVHECPAGAIRMSIEGAEIDADKCVGCGVCYDNCASEAIEAIANDKAGDDPC